MEYFIAGFVLTIIILFLQKGEPKKYVPTRHDRDDSNSFMQKFEDQRMFSRYCFEREQEENKIAEVNQYKDLPKDQWWYYFGIGIINIDWVEAPMISVYEVYHEPTAKYLENSREKMKAEYDALYPEKINLPMMFIPDFV